MAAIPVTTPASAPITFSVFDGASVAQNEPGSLDIQTSGVNWNNAVLARLEQPSAAPDAVGSRVILDLELFSGKIGAILTNSAGVGIGTETVIDATGRRRVIVDCKDPAACGLLIRNQDKGTSRARIYSIKWVLRRRINVAPILGDVLPALIRAPGEVALQTVASVLSANSGATIEADEIAVLEASGTQVQIPFPVPSPEAIFSDDVGQLVIGETERLVRLLSTAKLDKLGEFLSTLDGNFYTNYFKANIMRVYHLVHMMRDFGFVRGSVLEIGALMGNFSATLQRAGYDVTAVDRYAYYEGGLQGFTDYMRSIGVKVEEMTRDDEAERIAALGQFDAVICMAVIEHIPPPVRWFMEMLASHVKPGGLLLIDTPNIGQYWHRVKLSQGKSIHQDLHTQYYSKPPWEGHHREYTPEELVWMMQQVGCDDIKVRLLDQLMMQWEELWPDHLQSLLAMSVDPTLCANMLVGGRLKGA